jgi:DNA topoisomerase-1
VSSKPLVVVESPTKVKTIKKYLGNAYNVAATVGHIKDLPSKEMGIDIEKDFQPKYRVIPGKQKVVSSLKKEAGDAEDIYLAPDPDREGEAIAWHTAEVLKKKGRRFHRVLFHELTETGIREAMDSPEELNDNKYHAQKARRILDRLVGYQISPLLWRKVKNGLSAGRVQSVAVEYWTITAQLSAETPPPFTAKLAKKDGQKVTIPDEATAKTILGDLAGKTIVVEKVIKKTTRRNPLPPFTTSKLQQDAIRKLRFSAKKTMMVAQQLYEGIELTSGEPTGMITYMRTDSTRIAGEAAEEALKLIREQLGDDYAIPKPRFFKNRKKVQDAHEAIRPTSVYHTPDSVKPYLNDDQLALYTLIWKRFMASQMQPALIDNNSLTIRIGSYHFKASGSTVKFPGFMALYQVADDKERSEQGKTVLPDLPEGTELTLAGFDPKQHFTQPPPRFSEASLVKELEENGIGRPSTYATILSTIQDKGYVEKLKGYFRPSELGFIVNDLVVKSFPDVFDVEFTAKLEDDLDRVEAAEIDAKMILQGFYTPFSTELEAAAEGMLSMKGVGSSTGIKCPQCGSELHIKVGKNGPFLACSSYPDCNFSRDYTRDEKGNIQIIEPVSNDAIDKACDKCGKPMVIKRGRYGTFLACSGYPECKFTQSASAEVGGQSTGVMCPEEGCGGEMVERRSKRGKIFYGCGRFPECKYAIWDKPVNRPCPQCNAGFMVEKTTKKDGTFLMCLNPACGFRHTEVEKEES